MSFRRIIYIDNSYFDGLFQAYSESNLRPYLNKKVRNTPFLRPYICLDYSKHFNTIRCFPLSSYKRNKDVLSDPHYHFIVSDCNKIRGKIVLNCSLVVPRNMTHIINVSKESINKCQTRYKEWLIDLKNELQYCNRNYNLLKYLVKDYENLSKLHPQKYLLLDKDINLKFNKQFYEISKK